MEMNGGSSVPYLVCTPCVPLFCTLFNRGGNRRAFRLPGAGVDHFHCTVEPSAGHIRCRRKPEFPRTSRPIPISGSPSSRYDWTTGAPHDGNEWKKYRVVPCAHPSRTLLMLILTGLEAKNRLAFQGRRGIASVVRWNLRPVIFGVEL